MKPSGIYKTAPCRGLFAVAFSALVVTACDSSGPVDDTFLLQGEVSYRGTSTHELVSMDEGIARFEIVSLQPKLLDITGGSALRIGLGLGLPGEEECETTFRSSAQAGSVFSLGLEEQTEYCVLLFDPGSLPEDALVEYMVSVSPG